MAPRLFRSRRRNDPDKTDEKPILLRTNTQIARHTQHVRRQWWGLKNFMTSSPILSLLVFVPIGILGGHNGMGSTLVFTTSMLGILPLAMLLSNATEELAAVAGEVVGALLNATFGNAVEMIVSTVALTRGEIKIVQSSMLGAVLSNILLCLGTCLFIGGYKHDCQFNATAASTMASLMVVASSSLIVPAALNLAFPSISIPLALPPTAGSATSDSLPAILILSRGTSLILLVLYLIYLHFQLISHTHLFCEPHDEPESPGEHSNASNASTEAPPVTLQPPMAIGVLAIVSLLIAMCAENLVSTLDDVVSSMHINRTFIGLIILPIVGNAAEYVSAFRASARGKMSLALGVAVGSSMQIALFVTPALVILGWVLGQPMSLSFEPFGAVVFYLSVIVVEGVISDGDSNYLEGAMLVGVYMIVALGFFVFPTE